MLAKIRKAILFSALAFAVAVFATALIADTVKNHNQRERRIAAEIAKVSRYENAYSEVWEKLVAEHGSQDAALSALREWAESWVDYEDATRCWKRGEGTRPERPEPLTHFSTLEAHQLDKSNGRVPYGCSTTLNAAFKEWNGDSDGESMQLIMLE